MNKLTFLFLGSVPRNQRNLKGILLTAERMAKQLDPSINKILIKGAAHESSIKTATGERIPTPLHYTFHFKNDDLAKRNKHWSAHADIKLDASTGKPLNWYDTVLNARYDENQKTLHEDPDEYYDHKKGKTWNKWDPNLNQIKEFSEADLEGWMIGDNFIAYPPQEKGSKLPPKVIEEVKQDQEESKAATEAIISEEAVQPK